MYPPDETARAAHAASLHLQLRIDTIALHAGEVAVTGPVVRVFRGALGLMGNQVTVVFPCTADDDDWAPDGLGRFPAESIRVGRIVEAYLNPGNDGLEVAAGLVGIFDAPSSRPQLEAPIDR